ncbi:hypothetical protein DL93DRAFT_2099402 [Clavulina sp. PMI_390]|nr:hypothetical protein DL93DRAFT_2099402 [Clavulina sp. PMI_390]
MRKQQTRERVAAIVNDLDDSIEAVEIIHKATSLLLAKLTQKRAAVQQVTNAFLRLPDEILSEIFVLVYHHRLRYQEEDSYDGPEAWETGLWLSHVCRRMRAVAQQRSELWQELKLSFPLQTPLLPLFAASSRGYRLCLTIGRFHPPKAIQSGHWPHACIPITDIDAPQIRTIKFHQRDSVLALTTSGAANSSFSLESIFVAWQDLPEARNLFPLPHKISISAELTRHKEDSTYSLEGFAINELSLEYWGLCPASHLIQSIASQLTELELLEITNWRADSLPTFNLLLPSLLNAMPTLETLSLFLAGWNALSLPLSRAAGTYSHLNMSLPHLRTLEIRRPEGVDKQCRNCRRLPYSSSFAKLFGYKSSWSLNSEESSSSLDEPVFVDLGMPQTPLGEEDTPNTEDSQILEEERDPLNADFIPEMSIRSPFPHYPSLVYSALKPWLARPSTLNAKSAHKNNPLNTPQLGLNTLRLSRSLVDNARVELYRNQVLNFVVLDD